MRYAVMVFQMLSTGINPNKSQILLLLFINMRKSFKILSMFYFLFFRTYGKSIENELEQLKVHCQHLEVHAKTDTVEKIPGPNGKVHEIDHRGEVQLQK